MTQIKFFSPPSFPVWDQTLTAQVCTWAWSCGECTAWNGRLGRRVQPGSPETRGGRPPGEDGSPCTLQEEDGETKGVSRLGAAFDRFLPLTFTFNPHRLKGKSAQWLVCWSALNIHVKTNTVIILIHVYLHQNNVNFTEVISYSYAVSLAFSRNS